MVGGSATRSGRRRAFSPRAYRQCLRLLRGADLINSHAWQQSVGLPFCTLEESATRRWSTLSGSRSRLQTYGYRWWISPAARRIICPTDVLAGLLQNEGVPRELIEVIPNGVRLDAALPRREARVALGLNQKDFVVGIVARLREEKAHEVLFRAVARLRNEGRQISVCVVGDGPQRSGSPRRLRVSGSTVPSLGPESKPSEALAGSLRRRCDLFRFRRSPARRSGGSRGRYSSGFYCGRVDADYPRARRWSHGSGPR